MSVLAKIPAWFFQTNIGQQMAKVERSKIDDQRKKAAAELAKIAAEEVKSIGPLIKARDVAKAAMEKIMHEDLVKALADVNRTAGELHTATCRIERRRNELHRQLQESAPACIDQFEDDLERELEKLRKGELSFDAAPDDRELSNGGAIKRRALAITDARSKAEELKLLAASDEDLANHFDAIRRDLPGLDKFEPTIASLIKGAPAIPWCR